MRLRSFRPLLLVVAALAVTGCFDMRMRTKLNADGAGTMSVHLGLTEGFVKIVNKMKEIDPDKDLLEDADGLLLAAPTDEQKAALKAKGCELVSFEGEQSSEKIYSSFEVAFDKLTSLSALDAVFAANHKGKAKSKAEDGPGTGMTLVRNDDGTYTLAMKSPEKDGESEEGVSISETEEHEGAEEGEEAEGGESAEDDPETAAKKEQAAMEVMGLMMAEMANMKIEVGLEVPGEVVSYTPTDLAKVDGGNVTWTLDFAAMMASAGAGSNPMEDGFSVTFRLPEGTSLPEAALKAK